MGQGYNPVVQVPALQVPALQVHGPEFDSCVLKQQQQNTYT